jgi:hypothetical protein
VSIGTMREVERHWEYNILFVSGANASKDLDREMKQKRTCWRRWVAVNPHLVNKMHCLLI